MTRRWHWDFEGEHREVPDPGPRAPRPLSGPSREVQIRRRRRVLLVTLLALIAILIAAMPGSHHAAPSAASTTRAITDKGTGHSTASTPAGPGAVASVLAYTQFVKHGSGHAREVAITFDDGPGPYTPGVLRALEKAHARATFFEVGKMLQYFSPSTVREIRDGDVIGDHTQTHPFLAHLSAREQREQLFEPLARIEILGAPRPTLFRPPYGSFNAATLHFMRVYHLLMVLWSVDTGDYQQPGVSVIVQRALEGAHPGAIILMHDAGGVRTQTIEALPIIIHDLRAKGLEPVTVPQLLRDDPPPAGEPMPPNLSGD
jgi:peptidoglycan/xylan/chitin deacetylase (PgdA/CDA1 family)